MPLKLPPQAVQTERAPRTAENALRGIGVVITRPREASARLAALIEQRSGSAIVFPALEIAGLPLDAQVALTLSAAVASDYWFFISQHAVEHGVRLLREAGVNFAGVTAIAIGPSTQSALLAAGFKRVLVSAAGADSEAVLALPELQRRADSPPRSALIFRGRGGRERLREGLQALGFEVAYLECYERHEPSADAASLLEAWRSGRVQAVSAMSVQTLQNFAALIGAPGQALLRATPVFVAHERIAAAARAEGMKEVVISGIGDDALLISLCNYFGARRDGQQ